MTFARPHPDDDAAVARVLEIVRARLVTEGECLVYTGHCDAYGYGRVWIKPHFYKTTRLIYADAHGPIPPGLVVMHSCDNPPCCNLDHLSLGTQAENIADARAKGRARSVSDINRLKTSCVRGHPFSGHNLIVRPDGGGRYCRACRNERARRNRAIASAKRAAAA